VIKNLFLKISLQEPNTFSIVHISTNPLQCWSTYLLKNSLLVTDNRWYYQNDSYPSSALWSSCKGSDGYRYCYWFIN